MKSMEENTLEQIKARLAELPEDVRAAITSADLGKKIQEVGARQGLHVDQMADLEDEVSLTMLGFSPLDGFEKRLESSLKLNPDAARKLAEDIGGNIFGPIRESIKQFIAARTTPPPPQAPAAAQTPPMPPMQAPKPQLPQEYHPAEVMLSQKTATVPPAAPTLASAPAQTQHSAPSPAQPQTPPPYKVDPYREPPE